MTIKKIRREKEYSESELLKYTGIVVIKYLPYEFSKFTLSASVAK